jgi:endonuclease-3 related protein
MPRDRERLTRVHDRLLRAYGPQHWWPADGPFEVMVGAILTQNTSWTNVERALQALQRAGLDSAEAIAQCDAPELAQLLRPVGYFNVKARRLQAFCRWYLSRGGCERLRTRPTSELRADLLDVHGIGPETADDILLYAFRRPVFVIDAYTRRLFRRLGMVPGDPGYEHLRAWLEAALGPQVALYNEYHALIVRHAKLACRTRPLCSDCCLAALCEGRLDTSRGD